MYLRNLSWIGSFSLCLAACSSDAPDGTGTGGASSVGGSNVGGSTPVGGANSGGNTAVVGGAPGAGLGGSAVGGNGVGGASTGGAPGTGAATSIGGSLTGGATSGGATGDGGSGTGGDGGGMVGPGPSGWPHAEGPDDVPLPAGTPGDITVLNWAGFDAAVTYSFDDNENSQIANYDAMQALGVPLTFYLWTNKGTANDATWAKALADGHEIGNHTNSHGNCSGGSDIAAATSFIEDNLGVTPTTMAAPNGTDCFGDFAAAQMMMINRDVQPSQPVEPYSGADRFHLNCYIPSTGQAAGAFNSNIDDALSKNGWVIYVIHGFTDGYQPVPLNNWTQAVQYAKDKGNVWITTMANAGAYWLGQKAFADAVSETSGDSTTWTWTLPEPFAGEKYLRVTVEGGTLYQNGVALTWDPHGYYEIALDVGSVTLAP